MSERLLRVREVAEMCGMSVSEVYARAAEGDMPKQIQIGPHMARWIHSEVQQWIAHQIARCRQSHVRRAS